MAPDVYLLPPLDNVLWRRERVVGLFGCEYTWEIYLHPAKRRFGPYTMPVLEGDRFIGRIGATSIHWPEPYPAAGQPNETQRKARPSAQTPQALQLGGMGLPMSRM